MLAARAFSSEVDTGSRQENASNENPELRSDVIGTELWGSIVTGTMNLRQLIPGDMTASAAAHLSLLALILLFSDVRPFGAVTSESIPVEIVAPLDIPEQAAEPKPEPIPTPTPTPTPQLSFTAQDKPAPEPVAQQPPPSSPPPRPQKQAAVSS